MSQLHRRITSDKAPYIQKALLKSPDATDSVFPAWGNPILTSQLFAESNLQQRHQCL